jgi:putative spermidine/putrescine transport system substrate-binding protein
MTNHTKISRRDTLKLGAGAAAAMPLFNINHAWSADVTYDGGVFDAGGATINIGEWGGFWQDLIRKITLDDFEKQFNCKVAWDSAWPWFPKFVANAKDKPPYAITNWNYPEMFKTAKAGDFFLSLDEIRPNIPNMKDVWPFATANGVGVTWAYARYCYAYRTDMAEPAPTSFKDFWADRYAGKRGTYITSNTLQMDFFLGACKVFGKDQYDLKAGYDAMKKAMPMKISDFTGNMQALLERGEVAIAVQDDGEAYLQADKGIKVAAMIWEDVQPILTQTKTISRYADPMQKKLALALLNRTLDPEFLYKFSEAFFMAPVSKAAKIPDKLAAHGVKNTADAVSGFSVPDWNAYLDHEDDIVETVNEIFGSK